MTRSDFLKGKERPFHHLCGVKFTDDFCRFIGHPSMPAMRGHIVGKDTFDGRWRVDWGKTSGHQDCTSEADENLVRADDAPSYRPRVIQVDINHQIEWLNEGFAVFNPEGVRRLTLE